MNHNKKTYYLLLLTLLPAFAWQTWSFAAVQSIPPAQIASSLNEQATDALDIVAHHADQLDSTRAKKIADIFEKEKEALGKQINATQKTNVDDAVAALRNFAEGVDDIDITNFYTINKALESKTLIQQNNLIQYGAGATIDEVSAIHRHTVNNFELTVASYGNGYSAVQQSWINLIESGLNKMRPTKSFTGTVYRGSNLTPDHLQPFIDAWQSSSKNITIPPFQSTSKLENIADDFINFNTSANKTEVMFEIQSKTGVYIDDIFDYGKNLVNSRHPGRLAQEEVILNKNGNYRIDNLSTITKPDGTIRYIIKMTEL
jgi:hypothetical protein